MFLFAFVPSSRPSILFIFQLEAIFYLAPFFVFIQYILQMWNIFFCKFFVLFSFDIFRILFFYRTWKMDHMSCTNEEPLTFECIYWVAQLLYCTEENAIDRINITFLSKIVIWFVSLFFVFFSLVRCWLWFVKYMKARNSGTQHLIDSSLYGAQSLYCKRLVQ